MNKGKKSIGAAGKEKKATALFSPSPPVTSQRLHEVSIMNFKGLLGLELGLCLPRVR
jgi:hypothetical protein